MGPEIFDLPEDKRDNPGEVWSDDAIDRLLFDCMVDEMEADFGFQMED